ncbi:hypothetical protein [Vibrio rumoiensis]|uniref:hypothetical protein n=1 Tax=Vibrio rumoiensis TaxID=76258 RepID=UPI000B5C3791|nr:hypothetical protein [Vibrio rumoiensis]
MNITENPFNLLNASVRDDKSTLIDLAEDYSLVNDDDLGGKYVNDLTSPRRRLSIEISWLLGISENVIKNLINNIDDVEFIISSNGFNALSRANLLASSIERLSKIDKELSIKLITELSKMSESIFSDEIKVLINQERKYSSLLMVESLEDIESELENRKKYYKKASINLLDCFSSSEIVEIITKIIVTETNNGSKYCGELIQEVIGYYELKAQQFLKEEEGNIDILLSTIDDNLKDGLSESVMSIYIEELINVLKNWDLIAQPIQILYMSKGLKHEMSNNLAYKIRNLSLKLFNEYDYVKLTQRLGYTLQQVFEEDFEFKEKADQDLSDINDILHDRELSEEDREKFSKAITYEVEIGMAFKNRFTITPDIIEWKNTITKITDIQYIRWGALSSNSGTEYFIAFGHKDLTQEIKLRKKTIFSEIIDRLMKTAGIHILAKYMEAFKNDENISIGGVIVNDYGVQLRKSKMFSKDESEFVAWHNVEVFSRNGNFVINKIGNRKMNCALPYLNVNNVHILEAIIRMKFKKPGVRLSDALISN